MDSLLPPPPLSDEPFVWGGVVLWGVLLWVLYDWIRQQRRLLPDPAQLPLPALAWLRDGWRGGLQLALFQLWQGRHLAIRADARGAVLLESLPLRPPADAPLFHRLLHQYLRHPTHFRQLLADRNLQSRSTAVIPYHEKPLEFEGLIRGASGRNLLLARFGLLVLALLNLWSSQSPLETVMAMVLSVAMVVATLKLRPWNRHRANSRGKKVLSQFHQRFDWTLPYLKQHKEPPDLLDPTILVALYGLSGAAPWLPVAPPEPPAAGESGDGGSSGSGCGFLEASSDNGSSDSSSSDSGSSDSGGCGGGGCGGGD